MTKRNSRWAAVVIGSLSVALVTGLSVVEVLNEPTTPLIEVLSRDVLYQVVPLCFAFVGMVLVWHRPENRMSWLFATTGLLLAALEFVEEYADYSYVSAPDPLPLAPVAAWLAAWLWVPTFGFLGLLLLLWFPTGKVPSKRWLPLQYFDFALLVTLSGYVAFSEDPQSNAPYKNPLAIPGLENVADTVFAVIEPLYPIAAILSVASLVMRYRRSGPVERLQLKWFLAAASVFIAYLLVDNLNVGPQWVRNILEPAAFLSLPIASAAAILRYRLYDIDVIINRALVYTALTAVLVGLYAGGVLVFRTALDPITGDNDVAIAASTLAVAALFGPARRRIQSFIDHRFYRSRYDAQQMLEGFASRLRQEVDLDSVSGELLGVIGRTVHPAHASVWLREVAK
ncbi:MAG TPA: hypothetical protein VM784_07725 [Actinomycetota bacterium]|nr:hypothetical protein [Actinomycetota bacterium]